METNIYIIMHHLLSSPVSRHDICPNLISIMVELHKWHIVPVAIKISASNLFTEKVAYIMHNKHIFLGHPLWQSFGHRTIIMEWCALPRVITLLNLFYSLVHLHSRSLGYI